MNQFTSNMLAASAAGLMVGSVMAGVLWLTGQSPPNLRNIPAMLLLNSPEGHPVLEASCDIVVVDGTSMVQCDMLRDLLPGAGEER